MLLVTGKPLAKEHDTQEKEERNIEKARFEPRDGEEMFVAKALDKEEELVD